MYVHMYITTLSFATFKSLILNLLKILSYIYMFSKMHFFYLNASNFDKFDYGYRVRGQKKPSLLKTVS